MRPGLIRVVMSLYPAALRQRYGSEIVELLASSTRPWRDLADVGRSALGERVRAVSWPRVRPQMRRMAWLVAAPIAFGFITLLVSLLPDVVFTMLATLRHGVGYEDGTRLHDVVTALCVVPVAAETGWLGSWIGRRRHLRAPAVTAPVALAVGIFGLAVPMFPTLPWTFGNFPHLTATMAAVVAWCVAMVALGVSVQRLRRQRYKRNAVKGFVVTLGGGLVLLELVGAGYGLASGDGLAGALTVWPAGVVGLGRFTDPFWGLPAALTTCTAFALALVHAHAGGPTTGVGRRRADHLSVGLTSEARNTL